MMIPENLIDYAVEQCGQKYIFVYPDREWTEVDELSGSDRPTGKRLGGYYGICTNCRQIFKYPYSVPPDEMTNELMKKNPEMCPGPNLTECPNCSAAVISRKGWLSKKNLKYWFYVQMWDVIDPKKVILYEAIIQERDWSQWEEYNGPKQRQVYALRYTVLTLGVSQTYNRFCEPIKKAGCASDSEICGMRITNGFRPLIREITQTNTINEEDLRGTFLHGFLEAVEYSTNLEPLLHADYIIRMNEEPITELLYKSGYEDIANQRVFKKYPWKGTRLIDFGAKSPKKMFRGLKKNNAAGKMLELLLYIDEQDRRTVGQTDLEFAAEIFKNDKNAKIPDVAFFLLVSGKYNAREVYEILKKHFPLSRIVDYMRYNNIGIYRDYINAASDNGAPLNEARTAFPEDLTAAHDAAAIKKDEIHSEEMRKGTKKRRQALIKAGYIYQRRGICTVIPSDPNDIVREGVALSHCVGRYAEEHASGETNIIFIRHTDKPGEPWFTLEVDPDTLEFVQCYGYKNEVSGLEDNDYADEYSPVVGDFLRNYARRLRWGKEQLQKNRRTKKCRKTA